MLLASARPGPQIALALALRVTVRHTRAVRSKVSPPRLHQLHQTWAPSSPTGKEPWTLLHGLRIRIHGLVSIFQDKEHRAAWRNMPKAAFYAVKAGRAPGIYSTWPDCERQTKGYQGAKYKKFGTKAEAEDFIGGSEPYSKPAPAQPSSSSGNSTPSHSTLGQFQPRIELGSSATSALTLARVSSLPPHLAEIAKKGFSFTTAPHYLIVYTDGSSLGNGKSGARAGLGVYYGFNGQAEECGISERVPGELQTNNRGELLSVIRALEECPYPNLPLEVRTDSQYTIGCMTTWLPAWINKNFNGVKNADMIKHMLVLLRRRGADNKVKFVYVPGHSGEIGNDGADALARRGALRDPLPDRPDWLDPDMEDVAAVPEISEIEVEIDESWLLTEDDLAELEKDFA